VPTQDRYIVESPAECDVAIVGGGFGGLMSLARLAQCAPKCQFVVFERRPRRGPGVAYGACDPEHLLNVPAARMGAFVERPSGFLEWLEREFPGRYRADDFAPRALFGRYLLEVVGQTLDETRACASFVRDAVVHVEPLGQKFELLLASGRTVLARGVVLAPGLPQARAPWRAVDEGVARSLLVQDPWEASAFGASHDSVSGAASAAMARVPADAQVVVVGSGLTAIDVIMSLRRHGHRGKIVVVSRGGRFPLPHAASHGAPIIYDPAELSRGPLEAFRAIRRAVRALEREQHDWHAAIDGIRPHAANVWRAWPNEARAYFLRRLRPFWEIHRHRAPAHLLAAIEAERAAGSLELVAGSVHALQAEGELVARVVVRTDSGSLRGFEAARLVNCAGPSMSVGETLDPLLGSMLRMGMATTDSNGLGLRTDAEGRLVGSDGKVQSRLRLIGALRRGELWESTAVPELRGQAAAIAESLSQELGCGSARTHADRVDAAPPGAVGGCA
jgi:uncharacterized NAD(P)/FAD-binding protein YdhS